MSARPAPHEAAADRREFDLDEVVAYLSGLDVDAHIVQTGGGCATIHANAIHRGEGGRPRSAVAGPGSYGWGQRPSTASLAEFWVGPDDLDGADDPGATDAGGVGACGAWDVARLIFEQLRHPERVATATELHAIGFGPGALPSEVQTGEGAAAGPPSTGETPSGATALTQPTGIPQGPGRSCRRTP